MSKILFYPAFKDAIDLSDHLYRIRWYLKPFEKALSTIIVPHVLSGFELGEVPDYLDPELSNDKKALDCVKAIHIKDESELEELALDSDYVFVWSKAGMNAAISRNDKIVNIIRKKKIVKVDHNQEQFAGSFYLRFAENFAEATQEALAASKQRFQEYAKAYKSGIGYIFGTGPGLEYANEHDFSDGVTIACNSMIRNHELLDRLEPSLFVVGDPIFHAGPSVYASSFRQELVTSMDKYGVGLVVPMRDYHVYRTHLPSHLAEKVIAIPFKPDEVPNLDLLESLHVSTTGNILTLYLLPIAATLFDEIRIFGCDGRPMEQNQYFWSHHKASQFNDQMGDIQKAHPGFFAIDYNEYYTTHCETLAKWLDRAEELGKMVANMSPSFIPALDFRNAPDVVSPSIEMPSPEVSVIMPAFNAEGFIEEAIGSVLRQGVESLELLVVNDGSEDGTEAVIKGMAEKDGRIRLLQCRGKGVSAARNTGLEEAQGRFVGFLDSDDTMDPGALDARLQVLRHEEVHLVHGSARFVNTKGEYLGFSLKAPRDVTFKDMGGNVAHLNTVMGDASLMKKFRFEEGVANGEDWWYFSRLLRSGVVSKFVEGGGAVYRIHANSTVLQNIEQHEKNLKSAIEWIYSSSSEEGISPELADGLNQPEKPVVFIRRKFNLLLWSLYEGNSDRLGQLLNDEGLVSWLQGMSPEGLRNSVGVTGIRRFVVSVDKLKKLPVKDRESIRGLLESSQLAVAVPVLASLVSEIFDFNSLPRESDSSAIAPKKRIILAKDDDKPTQVTARKVTFFPVIQTEEEIRDLFGRASWFFGRTKDIELRFLVEDNSLQYACQVKDRLLGDDFGDLEVELLFHASFLPKEGWRRALKESDLVLLWKQEERTSELKRLLKGRKVYEVDSHAVREEGSFYIEGNLWLQSGKDSLIEDCRLKFNHLRSKLARYEKAYLLATGPSSYRSQHEDFSNSLVIGCNSLFLDEELMSFASLDILVFGDPIFHFGPSRYASEFRQKLVQAVRRYGFTIIIPFKYYPLLVDNYPELEPFTIGIPFRKDRSFNLDLLDDFCLKTTANILTFLMVPVGATFAKQLYLLGCDGRPMEEDSYFWQHNRATQFNAEMENIRLVHPGFFNIDYNEYYETHTAALEEQLESCREAGIQVTNRTFSYIAPLQAIHPHGLAGISQLTQDLLKPLASKEFLFISVHPNGESGRSQFSGCLAGMGGGSLAIIRKGDEAGGDEAVCPALGAVPPTATAGLPQEIRQWYGNFVDPLRLVLRELRVFQGTMVLYLDSANAASLNYFLIALRELDCSNCRVVVNMGGFHDLFGNPDACSYLKEVLQESKDLREKLPLYLGSDSPGIAGLLCREGERPLEIPVLLQEIPEPPAKTESSDVFEVYYPGGADFQEGFGQVAGIIQACHDANLPKDIQFTVNCQSSADSERAGKEVKRIAALSRPVNLHGSALNDKEAESMMSRCDLVLLPQEPEAFAHRLSTNLLNALMSGKPVVCSQGTWAGDLATRLSFGLAYDIQNPASVVDAIRTIHANHAKWASQVDDAREQWFEENSCRVFIQKCLGLPANPAEGAEFTPFDGISESGRASAHTPGRDLELSELRVLIVDPIRRGHPCATGMLKENLFSFFKPSNLASLSLGVKGHAAFIAGSDGKRCDVPLTGPDCFSGILGQVRNFDPHFLYIRPSGNPLDFFRLQVALCQPGTGFRTVLHMMDNWHEKAHIKDLPETSELEAGLLAMAGNADVCLGISPSMCQKLGARTGRKFQWLSNFITNGQPSSPVLAREADGVTRVLYAGAVTAETSLHTLVLLFETLASLQTGLEIEVVVQTSDLKAAHQSFQSFPFIKIVEYNPDYDAYLAGLGQYDLLLLAYNFDPATRAYLGDSMANKLPEYLSSGTPSCIVGPDNLSTVALCRRLPGVSVCSSNEPRKVKKFVGDLLETLPILSRDAEDARSFFQWMYRSQLTEGKFTRIVKQTLQQENEVWVGPYMRPLHASFAEDSFLGKILPGTTESGVMLDVGAHHGSSLSPFLRAGWDVHAFEPDPVNRKNLIKKFGSANNLVINPVAVDETGGKELPFYSSDESTGISSLNNFRDTHQEVQKVRTVCLRDYIRDNRIERVDFLKIDVEGFDFFALKGVPWESVSPRYIIAEFEDLKTERLGYSWEDMAWYLHDRGYQVLVSEWHPILRYGRPHEWRQLSLFPCKLGNPSAWGNLIAFKDTVDLPALANQVRKAIKFRRETPLSIESVANGNIPDPLEPAPGVIPAKTVFRPGTPVELPDENFQAGLASQVSLAPTFQTEGFSGVGTESTGALLHAMLQPGAAQTGKFIFSLDRVRDASPSGWCYYTASSANSPVKLRLCWNSSTIAETECGGLRKDLTVAGSPTGGLIHSGFAFQGIETGTAPRHCTLEAWGGEDKWGWQILCEVVLERAGGIMRFAPVQDLSPPVLAGEVRLGQNQYAYHFHQPSKRMKEYSGGKLTLKGWCFSHGMVPVERIRIQLPKCALEGVYGYCKPAVSECFGLEDLFHRCGFEFQGLPVPRGATPFTLEAFSGSKQWLPVCHGKIVVSWFSSKVRIHPL